MSFGFTVLNELPNNAQTDADVLLQKLIVLAYFLTGCSHMFSLFPMERFPTTALFKSHFMIVGGRL